MPYPFRGWEVGVSKQGCPEPRGDFSVHIIVNKNAHLYIIYNKHLCIFVEVD